MGLSDHTMGITVPVTAVALGACIVEKHITLSRSLKGPDSGFSLEPQEFKAMVERFARRKGHWEKSVLESARTKRAAGVFRRSLFRCSGYETRRILHRRQRSVDSSGPRPAHATLA